MRVSRRDDARHRKVDTDAAARPARRPTDAEPTEVVKEPRLLLVHASASSCTGTCAPTQGNDLTTTKMSLVSHARDRHHLTRRFRNSSSLRRSTNICSTGTRTSVAAASTAAASAAVSAACAHAH